MKLSLNDETTSKSLRESGADHEKKLKKNFKIKKPTQQKWALLPEKPGDREILSMFHSFKLSIMKKNCNILPA